MIGVGWFDRRCPPTGPQSHATGRAGLPLRSGPWRLYPRRGPPPGLPAKAHGGIARAPDGSMQDMQRCGQPRGLSAPRRASEVARGERKPPAKAGRKRAGRSGAKRPRGSLKWRRTVLRCGGRQGGLALERRWWSFRKEPTHVKRVRQRQDEAGPVAPTHVYQHEQPSKASAEPASTTQPGRPTLAVERIQKPREENGDGRSVPA